MLLETGPFKLVQPSSISRRGLAPIATRVGEPDASGYRQIVMTFVRRHATTILLRKPLCSLSAQSSYLVSSFQATLPFCSTELRAAYRQRSVGAAIDAGHQSPISVKAASIRLSIDRSQRKVKRASLKPRVLRGRAGCGWGLPGRKSLHSKTVLPPHHRPSDDHN